MSRSWKCQDKYFIYFFKKAGHGGHSMIGGIVDLNRAIIVDTLSRATLDFLRIEINAMNGIIMITPENTS